MPHDSAPPDYGAKVLAKARVCVDFSVEAVKLRVPGAASRPVEHAKPVSRGTRLQRMEGRVQVRLSESCRVSVECGHSDLRIAVRPAQEKVP